MKPPATPNHFDRQSAERYDERWAPLAPLRDSLHLQMRLILQELPTEARVLCIGAGTGAELLALAKAFPSWRFVAVDPSAPMLDVCRQRAEQAGITGRCEFHAAYVHELPADLRFDAATAILVSQFVTDPVQRIAFFREIARRLQPGSPLVSADLAHLPTDQHAQLLPVWRRLQALSGATPEQIEQTMAAYGRNVAVLPPAEIEAMLVQAGFAAPVPFSQSLLIHAWFARRAGPATPHSAS